MKDISKVWIFILTLFKEGLISNMKIKKYYMKYLLLFWEWFHFFQQIFFGKSNTAFDSCKFNIIKFNIIYISKNNFDNK